jgi:hypothetical protein
MDIDPESLDPDERMNKLAAIASLALGIVSLFASIVPVCGGGMGLLGIVAGWAGMKSDYHKLGLAGLAVSGLGLLIAITYTIFQSLLVQ